jgi:hypothetical protein
VIRTDVHSFDEVRQSLKQVSDQLAALQSRSYFPPSYGAIVNANEDPLYIPDSAAVYTGASAMLSPWAAVVIDTTGKTIRVDHAGHYRVWFGLYLGDAPSAPAYVSGYIRKNAGSIGHGGRFTSVATSTSDRLQGFIETILELSPGDEMAPYLQASPELTIGVYEMVFGVQRIG